MQTKSMLPSLPALLTTDAVTCAVMGGALLVAATALSGVLSLPVGLLREAGLILLPFAVLLAWAGRPARGDSALVPMLIAGNVAWVIASLALLTLVAPSPLGTAFVLTQAVAVAAITVAEALAWRRARAW